MGPKCFRWMLGILSGSEEFKFLSDFTVFHVSSCERWVGVWVGACLMERFYGGAGLQLMFT